MNSNSPALRTHDADVDATFCSMQNPAGSARGSAPAPDPKEEGGSLLESESASPSASSVAAIDSEAAAAKSDVAESDVPNHSSRSRRTPPLPTTDERALSSIASGHHSQAPHGPESSKRVVSALLCCCARIPICGGWCDANVSPEVTCLRQFSNEKTVPRPCLWRGGCRRVFESSLLPRHFGRVGFAFADVHRAPIMTAAFCVSFLAWCCMLLSGLALTESDALVRSFAWAVGNAESPARTITATRFVGVSHRILVVSVAPSFAVSPNASLYSSVAWTDEEACSHEMESTCEQCALAAGSVTKLAIASILTQMVQMATDLQRTTPYGDMNCQKLMGVITGFYGLISGLKSLHYFSSGCWRSQPTTFTWEAAPELGAFEFEARWGPGLGLMWLATLLKAVDIVCHLIVPTPRRKRETGADDRGWSLPEYCAAGATGGATRFGYYVRQHE